MQGVELRVLRLLRRESLVPDRGRVVVALSGGADSVALCLLLRAVAPTAGFQLAGVCHLNHQLREDADDDERFCRQLAEGWGLPIEVAQVDVGERATRERMSVEEAGHHARHEFFARALQALRADRVATAHTRHDQAETVLMRLCRGAGPVGLSGIHPRSGRVIRPLLDVSRPALRSYLTAGGQAFREDPTNQDPGVTRNRVRHAVLPVLEEICSPGVVDALARAADVARHDAAWLEEAANRVATGLVDYTEGVASFDRRLLATQPLAVSRRVVKDVLERVSGRGVGFAQVERLVDLVVDPSRTSDLDFPGCRVRQAGHRVVVGPPVARQPPVAIDFEYLLPIPGEVRVPEAALTLSAEPGRDPRSPGPADRHQAWVSAEKVTHPLVVRSWRPGDRFKPLGLGGRKKVQDVFTDQKTSRRARQTVPIVADATRGIVWVVGHALAEDFRVTPGSEGVLRLKARKLGGAG